MFVRFRVISCIVLVRVRKQHETKPSHYAKKKTGQLLRYPIFTRLSCYSPAGCAPCGSMALFFELLLNQQLCKFWDNFPGDLAHNLVRHEFDRAPGNRVNGFVGQRRLWIS